MTLIEPVLVVQAIVLVLLLLFLVKIGGRS
jgi:hypothetical protein